jgi:hypothetical protein
MASASLRDRPHFLDRSGKQIAAERKVRLLPKFSPEIALIST